MPNFNVFKLLKKNFFEKMPNFLCF